MIARAGRPTTVITAFLAIVSTIAIAGCSTTPGPAPTEAVAALTDAPAATSLPVASSAQPGAPTVAPSGPEPSAPAPSDAPPVVGITPGTVNHSSFDLTASYHVNAAISVASGGLDVTTTIKVTNSSDAAIDHLDLNTVAARLGDIRIAGATVDGNPVNVVVQDQTLVVPLGGILPVGGQTEILLEYRAHLQNSSTGSNWMFSRAGGTLALYRWIPWVSRAVPFDRPNQGDPFVLPTSPRVDVELLTDEPMVLAGPSPDVTEVVAGPGRAWSFSMLNVRDVSLVLAPDFQVFAGKAGGVPVRVFAQSGSRSGARLLALATSAVKAQAGLLGVAYPWPSVVVVETKGGTGLESPGLVWVPENLSSLNRTYMVNHEIAHQWFYGLVGNDQQADPFADEAAADMLARSVLGNLRPTRCAQQALDRGIRAYSSRCYYEVIYVQGGLLLDTIRREMGTNRFWAAMKTYLDAYRFAIASTKDLLETLRAASPVNLLPLLRVRFPTLY